MVSVVFELVTCNLMIYALISTSIIVFSRACDGKENKSRVKLLYNYLL